MKNFPFKRVTAARWQLRFKGMAALTRLVPQKIASDDPPYEDDEAYSLMLRRRERSLGR